MQRRLTMLIVAIFSVFVLSGCLVAESKYIKKVEESDKLSREHSALMENEKALSGENQQLQNRLKALNVDIAGLSSEKEKVTEELKTALKEKDATIKEVEKVTTDRDELDRVLKSRSDTLSKTIRELRKKITDLEEENTSLKKEVSSLEAAKASMEQDIEVLKKTKEKEVQTLSKTYENLVQEMKSEVAEGQITITELKGKLTLDVLDEILFDSGQAEIKPNGLAVLQRVIDILKEVKDKLIRIEGHTDNNPIRGALLKKYPTNWELSAARATNVTRYLQNQGIDPVILSAAAYGEYVPMADNGTPEGRAKNRRIAIILLPKD
jgi:chemotaxis protein MotB